MAEAEPWEPGVEGLTFLPYLAGERTPHADPDARGAFAGLSLRHDRGALARAVLEGVAFGLRDSLDLLRELGVEARVARASGGGARERPVPARGGQRAGAAGRAGGGRRGRGLRRRAARGRRAPASSPRSRRPPPGAPDCDDRAGMGPERAAGALPSAVPRAARRAVALIFAVDGAVVGSWAARVPALQDRAGVSTATLGLALAGLAAGALVAMPISGWRTARDGSRRTTLVWRRRSSSRCRCRRSPRAPWADPRRHGAGAANGAIDVAMNAHGVEVERRLRRPVLSSLHAAFSAGGLAGAGAGALVAGAGRRRAYPLRADVARCSPSRPSWRAALLPAGADAAPPACLTRLSAALARRWA